MTGFGIWKGTAGLAGAGLGIGLGALVSTVSHLLKRKAWEATGPKIVSAVMSSLLASFGLFVTASIVLGLVWKEGAPAALLTALSIYLTVSFHEAFTGQPAPRGGKGGRK